MAASIIQAVTTTAYRSSIASDRCNQDNFTASNFIHLIMEMRLRIRSTHIPGRSHRRRRRPMMDISHIIKLKQVGKSYVLRHGTSGTPFTLTKLAAVLHLKINQTRSDQVSNTAIKSFFYRVAAVQVKSTDHRCDALRNKSMNIFPT